MKCNNHISKLLKTIPNDIGVYQYYDKNQSILYVGKAKNLKKRVSSYFSKNQDKERLKILVSKIYDIKCIIVKTELDALLLENNLIKTLQPKYNVLLKDSKTYPWICISKEPVPKIFQTRVINNNSGEYFGPYASSHIVKTLLGLFSDLFYSHGWTPISYINRNIKSEKELQNYLSIIDDIRRILTGNLYSLMMDLKKKMLVYAKQLKFEKAQLIKEQLTILKQYQAKSIMVHPKITNVDVFTIVSEEEVAFVNFLKINSGCIIQSYTLEIKKQIKESEEKLLQLAIIEINQKFNTDSKKIYCSHAIESLWDGVVITVPKIGDKKKLISLSLKNAKHTLLEWKKQKNNNLGRYDNLKKLDQLKKDLNLKNLPKHIECFDNSNIQGALPVAACVVFKNGRASKKDYRNFNIKSVNGINDYASMQEVVYRRYLRCLNENKKLPDLIIIDGGKGQLKSAVKSLETLQLRGKIAIIGVAKRLEEIYFPGDKTPLYLNKRSESLRLIQKIRNEAHRFAITNHRNKRSKQFLNSSLDKIPGIGPKTIDVLITHFGSFKNIKKAKKEDLIALIGENKTNSLLK